MRVAFFGSSTFSCLVLGGLMASEHEVVAIVTQPDQPAGRKMNLCSTQVCAEAQALGVPVLMPERVKGNPQFRADLMETRPEALMVASYGQILSKKVLALTKWPLNVHPSALPRLRGASPVRSALLKGLTYTEVCIMRMTPRLDDGDVLLREGLHIDQAWDHAVLEFELGAIGGELAARALTAVVAGTAHPTPQDHDEATYSPLFKRADTYINWARPTVQVGNFVRAWSPDVGACTTLPNGKRLKVWSVVKEQPPDEEARKLAFNASSGTIVCVTNKGLWVAVADGVLRIDEVQPQDRQRMPMESFLAGNRLGVGDSLGQGLSAGG